VGDGFEELGREGIYRIEGSQIEELWLEGYSCREQDIKFLGFAANVSLQARYCLVTLLLISGCDDEGKGLEPGACGNKFVDQAAAYCKAQATVLYQRLSRNSI